MAAATQPRRYVPRGDPRECEALRLLRAIVEGSDEEMAKALPQARQLLKVCRGPVLGRPCTTTPEQLREMSRRRAKGLTRREIAEQMKLPRRLVEWHLRPSVAMQDALMETNA